MTNSIGRLVRRNPYGGTTFLRRLLQAGFWFFLLKGLLWLAVPAILVALGGWPSARRQPAQPMPALLASPIAPVPIARGRRPARISLPEPCPHCGLRPRQTPHGCRREPRILGLTGDRRSLAIAIDRAKASARTTRSRRQPRIIQRH